MTHDLDDFHARLIKQEVRGDAVDAEILRLRDASHRYGNELARIPQLEASVEKLDGHMRSLSVDVSAGFGRVEASLTSLKEKNAHAEGAQEGASGSQTSTRANMLAIVAVVGMLISLFALARERLSTTTTTTKSTVEHSESVEAAPKAPP